VNATADRRSLAQARRIVIKLGTGVVTHDGVRLALGRLHGLVEEFAELRKQGKEVLVVSSGAVGLGMRQLGLRERPASLGMRQACAAVGQGHLIALYTQAFAQLGLTAAQVLLTQGDLGNRDHALCLRTTLTRLLELGTVPILNENDSVSVRELIEYWDASGVENPGAPRRIKAFGDNDGLSARVAVAVDADLLVLLTDVDGLYSGNPNLDPTAVRIDRLPAIDDAVLAMTGGKSSGGTGGMRSKLEAARIASEAGIATLIATGHVPRVLARALQGEDLGTWVEARGTRSARRRAIATDAHRGALVVNDGAIRALIERKASLLPVGVVAVEGRFERGDVIEIRDGSGRVHGRGLANYDAAACAALAGHQSSEIDRILGFRGYDALVTRDNLVLTEV